MSPCYEGTSTDRWGGTAPEELPGNLCDGAQMLRTGRDSPSCHRAMVHSRSDRRFRYGTT